MFSKALQEHENISQVKPSSWSKANDMNSQPLEPSPPSSLNTRRSPWLNSGNSLKRTASQLNGWNSSGATRKDTQRVPTTRQPANVGERVGNLHVNVVFDEDDFEDDENINLDDDPPAKNLHSEVHPSISLGPLGNTITTPKTPGSSVPIPWSSSPQEHHQLPVPMPKSEIEPTTRGTKRRKLPWTMEADANSNNNPTKISDFAFEKNDETNKGKNIRSESSESRYPWNKTASAVKEEQKKFRQGHKKNVKDNKISTKAEKKKKREVLPHVFLSDEQKMVLKLVVDNGKSVFFTGSAGTGKSVLLREIIKALAQRYHRESDRVAVTASTGLAACNVGGVTLHSFAGIGLGKEPAPELVRKIKKNAKAKNRWLRTKVLVVDEISMVDGDLFDKLEEVARSIRNNGRPFGGIQLVITGDFFQLPPVPENGRQVKFSFDAATWNTSIEHTIGLTHVFRQKDPVFANMLNEMRLGKLTQQSIGSFRSLQRPLDFKGDFEATELFPTRIEVDNANSARMKNLAGREFEFKAVDGGSIADVTQRDRLLANCMAPQSITLKKGAQVMLIKNIDDSLVNGSVGKVVAFMDERTFDIYHDDEDSFQPIENGDGSDGELAQSRLKLKQLINKDSTTETSQKWPLVRFTLADGSTRDLLCQREAWSIELPNGEIQASRSQIPLILAWALSIHKAQGQTLNHVKVDLGKIFEKGQAYVALSRATCQEGLQIMRFDPKKVMAHDRVRTFYDGLYSVQQAIDPSEL